MTNEKKVRVLRETGRPKEYRMEEISDARGFWKEDLVFRDGEEEPWAVIGDNKFGILTYIPLDTDEQCVVVSIPIKNLNLSSGKLQPINPREYFYTIYNFYRGDANLGYHETAQAIHAAKDRFREFTGSEGLDFIINRTGGFG